MTRTRVVIDASVFVRAIAGGTPAAREWFLAVERRSVLASAPDLVYAEVGHALLRYVRGRRLTAVEAAEAVEAVAALPLRAQSLRTVAPAALTVAIERSLSAYDACYVSLAEAENATLVTADRRLADAYERVELVG